MKTFVLTQAIVSPLTYNATFILTLQSFCNELFKALKCCNNYLRYLLPLNLQNYTFFIKKIKK